MTRRSRRLAPRAASTVEASVDPSGELSMGGGRSLSRRDVLVGGLALGAVLAACGDDSGGGSTADATTTTTGSGSGATGAATTTTAAAFPVTITDKFGSVTVTKAPATIVSVGRTDHDVLLALGIVPAAVRRFLPTMTRGVGVWAEPKLGSVTPVALTLPLNYEQIAALRPELIVDVQSFGDETEYKTLTAIAPTLGLPKDATPNAVPWQQVTDIVATAVGRKADGVKLVAETEAHLKKVATANPSFAKKTVSVLLAYTGKIGVYGATDSRMQLMTALGFTPSAGVSKLGTDKYFYELSPELVGDADADVVVVLSQEGDKTDALFTKYPTLAATKANTEGRMVVVEDLNVALALSGSSVLSIPYAVDALATLIAAKVK